MMELQANKGDVVLTWSGKDAPGLVRALLILKDMAVVGGKGSWSYQPADGTWEVKATFTGVVAPATPAQHPTSSVA
jgi:hypothetical protein